MTAWQITSSKDFGRAVRQVRRQEGLTQRELAHAVGAGERFIVELENGKETIRLGKALEVAAVLGIDVSMNRER